MKQLRITLFGKLSIRYDGLVFAGCEASKVQELFCYLLIHSSFPTPYRPAPPARTEGSDRSCTPSQSWSYSPSGYEEPLSAEIRREG